MGEVPSLGQPPLVVHDLARALVMNIERRRVTYEGWVQGVGFRMTARRLASGFPVSGYVRNQADGRVELLAEGEPHVVASYLRSIQQEFGDMILDIREELAMAEGESYSGFTIRY